MNRKQVTPNLTQLTKFGLMNAYLVREDDGLTLVDTMMSAADDLIAAAAGGGRTHPPDRADPRTRRPRRLARRTAREARC